jgi:hypothetical protein
MDNVSIPKNEYDKLMSVYRAASDLIFVASTFHKCRWRKFKVLVEKVESFEKQLTERTTNES